MLNKYVVERDIASAQRRAPEDAASVIARARRLFSGVGTGIVWVESFVTGDKACAVYLATDETLVHRYARASTADDYRVLRVLTTVQPGSAA